MNPSFKRIQGPSRTTLTGRAPGYNVTVKSNGGKPPKLRWKPGSFVLYQGELHEISYAYRLADDPHEWRFALQERKGLRTVPEGDVIAGMLSGLGAGNTTPRTVYELFRNGQDVHAFFCDIPLYGNVTIVTNKMMIQNAKLVSSGEVI